MENLNGGSNRGKSSKAVNIILIGSGDFRKFLSKYGENKSENSSALAKNEEIDNRTINKIQNKTDLEVKGYNRKKPRTPPDSKLKTETRRSGPKILKTNAPYSIDVKTKIGQRKHWISCGLCILTVLFVYSLFAVVIAKVSSSDSGIEIQNFPAKLALELDYIVNLLKLKVQGLLLFLVLEAPKTRKPTILDITSCSANSYLVGDGVCDEITNNARCFFDGGDCCLEEKKTIYCLECTCKMDTEPLLKSLGEFKFKLVAENEEKLKVG